MTVLSCSMEHILLLEDDAGVSAVIVGMLQEEKYYVSTTTRVGDAREVLERVKIDLFIADVLLADGTAFAALDAAQQREVPYFLITGSISHMAVAKPFKLSAFMDAVRDRIGPADGSGRN